MEIVTILHEHRWEHIQLNLIKYIYQTGTSSVTLPKNDNDNLTIDLTNIKKLTN